MTHTPTSLRIMALAFMAGLSLSGCAASGGSATSQKLSDIVRAERGEPVADLPECTVPEGVIGKTSADIPAMKLKNPIRVIFPGTAVTSDHVSNRLNFKVDKKGVIKSVTCG